MLARRDVVLVATAVVAAGGALTGLAVSRAATAPQMHSRVFDWAQLKPEASKTGERREVFDAPTATLERLASHVTTLNPGQAPHPAHKHPEEELMIVRQGTLEVTLNGQATRVETGGMIFCASNEMHGLRNVGTTPAIYYVVKWFPRDLGKAKP
jgi:quercetin dioxygenase-like cupin family protein